ncbi:hypothetical protein [uncultured Parasphingorhabdus sp.]|uniref:hypothetical protein n=1 Tax=uncultured Parasphingorhabdus sp. TaxID=2709694 RepID=UPI0030DDA7B4|tara:strand:+ start:30567 stop:30821 length:255 start_codon:yes stop_codon:yes gene_type:complete
MSDLVWALIPLAPFMLGGLVIWTRHQSKMAEKYGHLPGAADPDAERMREEMKYLKDRVAVLEQITTDGHSSKQLKNEIEQLRDR